MRTTERRRALAAWAVFNEGVKQRARELGREVVPGELLTPLTAHKARRSRRNAIRYAVCMSTELVARISDALAAAVDELVEAGVFSSRSEAVRAGLEDVLERERRAATGRAIVEGYKRIPQEGDDLAWSDAATAAMIAEEPWRANRDRVRCGGLRRRTSVARCSSSRAARRSPS